MGTSREANETIVAPTPPLQAAAEPASAPAGLVLGADVVLSLQRTSGNRAVTRLLAAGGDPRVVRPRRALVQRTLLLDQHSSAQERQEIQVVPLNLDPSTIAVLERAFASGGGSGVPGHVRVIVDASLAPLRAPLETVVNEIAVAGAPNARLPLGATTTVALSRGRFRVTSFYHSVQPPPAANGSRPAPVRQWTVVVEPVGPPAPPSATGPARAQPQWTGTWAAADRARVLAALDALPASVDITGVHFRRGRASPDGHGGLYSSQTRTITLYDEAFRTRAESGAADFLTETVVHELGHHDDNAPLRAADQQTHGQPSSARDPVIESARSHSGLRYERQGHDFVLAERPHDVTGDFRVAAESDGAAPSAGRTRVGGQTTIRGGLTDYADEHWEEYYAEAYAHYFVDPDVLRSLRPNVFDYFEQRFHRWTPAAAPAAQPAANSPQPARR